MYSLHSFLEFFIKIITLLFILFFSVFATEKVNVFILHSYSQEYEWTKKQHNSFVTTLEKTDKKIFFCTEYLDTKRVGFTQEYKDNFLNYLHMKYVDATPDLIYATDDDALNFIYENYNKIFFKRKDIPVFFSGINNLDMDTILDKKKYAGVYEIKEIKPNINLIKQFSPQTRDIYFLGDNSTTYQSIKNEIESKHSNFKNMNFNYISDYHLSKVLEELPTKPRSFIVLTTIGGFKDDQNKTLLPSESIEKIKQNPNLILLSMEDAYMNKGVVGGYVTSGEKQGKEAADLVLKYLNEKSFKNIHSDIYSPNIYLFNAKELRNSRIILSNYIERKAFIVDKDKNFLEKNLSLLLNIFTIMVMILILVMIALYAIQRKKYLTQKKELSKIDSLRNKLYIKDQLLHNTFELSNIGYWRLDTLKDTLFVSQKLLNTLQIDANIYRDDSKLITYFVHSDDRELFLKKLQEVQFSHEPLIFEHKMVTSRKSVLHVREILYTEDIKYNDSSVIIGIIQFEK